MISFPRVLVSAATFYWAQNALGAGVESFSPEGAAKSVRQVKARFTEPMVPFGDLRPAAPFEVKCGDGGVGRWVDPELWVYDFKEELPAGVGCEFKVRPGLKSLAGKAIEARNFTFSTGGPAIQRTSPYEGAEYLTEDQAFVLLTDAPVDAGSMKKPVYFEVEGIAERVGFKIIEGSDRKAVLEANYYKNPKIQDTLLVLQARQTFPPKAKVTLVWGAGVKSKSGVVSKINRRFEYRTRDAFRAEFNCERTQAEGPCTPLSQMMVRFSSAVSSDVLGKIVLKGPNGWTKQAETWGEGGADYLDGARFRPPFPENSTLTLELPKSLKDDFGRPLANEDRYPLSIKTAAYPTLAKFSGSFGIVESKGGGFLPVTVRNVEKDVKASLLRLGAHGASGKVEAYFGDLKGSAAKISSARLADIQDWLELAKGSWEDKSIFSGTEKVPAPKASPKPFKISRQLSEKDFEVVGIPLSEPGFYVVELESPQLGAALLGKEGSFHVPTTVLVTNLAVHFKLAPESSLAWVTQLDDGKPVKGAQVKVWNCKRQSIASGETDAQGLAHFGALDVLDGKEKGCGTDNRYSPYDYGLFVTAEAGPEMAFVHTSWNDGIERWRFQVSPETTGFPLASHAVLDRTLFRAGETAHMKLFLRKQTGSGLELAAAKEQRSELKIEHEGSGQTYKLKVKWDATGSAETEWPIPKEAKLGVYRLSLPKDAKDHNPLSLGSFRVEEFRIPLLRAMLNTPTQVPIAPKKLPLSASVIYLSGGPAADMPVKVRTKFGPSQFSGTGPFEPFKFANGDVKEEKKRPANEEDEEEQKSPFADVKTKNLALDKSGTVEITVEDVPKSDVPIGLYAELEFTDPSGEVQTVSRTTRLLPSSVLVGLKSESYSHKQTEVTMHGAAVDPKGKPIADQEVVLDLFSRDTFTHRKRILGGYYVYEHFTEVKRIGELCRQKTDRRGRFTCVGKSSVGGNVIVRATTKDAEGRSSFAREDIWVYGKDDWRWELPNHDRMDLLAEETRYEPGQTARFQVRMPYQKATALVTVEREGVIESFVRELSGKEPVVEIPIKGSYAPNVFVSVLAIRGRVGDPKPTGLVDLGKPSYKFGLTEIKVGTKAHELKVAVKADREVYRVREKAKVTVKVTPAMGKLGANAEVVIAAVDEGLLELWPNKSWNLLEAMMGRRGYLVGTSTAQMHVIGKRHFGLKALPAGGGGGLAGGGSTRELFDTLLLWKARVKLSPSGEAKVEIPLNDSLTSFKLVAVASAGAGQFGTGDTSVRTSQDLMVLPGIPPLARSGDKLRVGVQLRNTTTHKMTVQLSGSVGGVNRKADSLAAQTVALAPQEAKEAFWDYQVPAMTGELRYTLKASAGGGDTVSVSQKIVDSVPVRAVQGTVLQASAPLQMPVALPVGAEAGRGGVQVKLSPTLVGGLEGVRAYMEQYPYTCLEQQVSRAIALRDRKLWDKAMAKLPGYLDGAGFAKYFPTSREGSEVLSAYLVSVAAAAEWPLPATPENKLLMALEGFAEGRIPRKGQLETSDLSLRKVAALEALAGNGKRLPKLAHLSSVEGDITGWPTSGLIDWVRMLKKVEPGGERFKKGMAQLKARVALQGTTLAFSTEKTDHLWWLMASGDTNAVRALHTLSDEPEWKKDAPRLATGSIGRLHGGHWDLTTANAWGVLAVERFAKLYEKTPVAGQTLMSLGTEKGKVDWKEKGTHVRQFGWPEGKGALDVKHAGAGAPWISLLASAAIALKEPLSAGYRVEKKITPVEQKTKGKWSRGDLARVSVKVTGQSPMTWVVINDPIPTGSALLGTGLGRDSALATQGEKTTGTWASVAFEERSFEGFRRYLDYLPEGDYQLEYTVRLNNPGTFQLPPTRVEAMYAPEMFGEIPNAIWEVGS